MIYTVPWAPVIALSVVLLLFLVVPLVAFVALAVMLLVLALALVSALVTAVLVVPPMIFEAVRRRMPRLDLAAPRLRVPFRRQATLGDARLDRVP